MKIGNAVGTPQEITDFFENNGMDPNNFFTQSEPPLNKIWFIVPSVIILIVFVVLTLYDELTAGQTKLGFLIGCGASLWLTINIQLRFKSPWATGVLAIGLLLLMLVAIGVLTPRDLLEQAKSLRD